MSCRAPPENSGGWSCRPVGLASSLAVSWSLGVAIRNRALSRKTRTQTLPILRPLQFENLSLRIKSGRRILHDVSGDFPHSHVHAIMGPSGSGKSSFITALIGKSNGGAISGNVAVWKSTKRDELAGGGGPQVNVQESLGTACTYDDVR